MKYLIRTKPFNIIAPLITALVIMQGCNVKEPTAPNWDVSLNLPITNKSYTLFDIVEKKSSLVQHYTQGTNINLLYYSDVKKIDKITLNNQLKINDFSKTASQTMGVINVNSDSVGTTVGLDWLGSLVTPGSQVQVPAIGSTSLSTNFSSAGQFKTVTILSGTIDIKITNLFPSPIVLNISSFAVKDISSGATVAQYSPTITIQPGATSIVKSIPLTAGAVVENQLRFECAISTGGSNGQSIKIPNNSLAITTVFHDLKVSQATAIIPSQNPVVIDGTALIDAGATQPNMFSSVKLDGGNMSVSITNNLNLDAKISMTIDNLLTPQGVPYTYPGSTITRNSTTTLLNKLPIAGYSFVSTTGSPTNQVVYHITFNLTPSGDFRTLSSTDGVTGTINITGLSINQFSGQLQPTNINQIRTAVSLSVQDIQNKLSFQQINIKNPIIELHLHPTANIEFSVNGRIEARNSLGQRSVMSLSSRTMDKTVITPSDSIITLNADSISNFFKGFSKFPDSLIVYAGGVANPNYKTISVKSSDQVTGNGHFEFPFQFGLLGGIYADSVNVDLSQDDRDKIKNVNTLQVSLNITNGVAASIGFTGKFYDRNNNFLMYFPPKYQDQDTVITVAGAATDADGNVTSPNVQTLSVRTAKSDTPQISNAAYMRVRIKFNTAASGNQPVKFKTDDVIKINAFGATDYNVKP